MATLIRLLKELVISILLLAILSGVIALAFYNKIPIGKEIPETITYKNIDLNQYGVRGDVENETAETKRYQSKESEFELFETERRYLPGKINPFSSISATTDLPTEVINRSMTRPSNPNGQVERFGRTVTAQQCMGEMMFKKTYNSTS